MQDLITIKEAATILDVTLSTVSYYIRSGKLTSVDGTIRTAHRRKRQMVSRSEVDQLKRQHDEADKAATQT